MMDNQAVTDDIWVFVEDKLKATVPAYFKHVLKVCGYDNGISISGIEEEDVKYIQAEVRGGNVGKAFNGSDVNFLEGCPKSPDNFEFVLGHKKFLMAIVGFLKNHLAQNGLDSFSLNEKPSKKAKNKAPEKDSGKLAKKTLVLPSQKEVGTSRGTLKSRILSLVEYAMSTELDVQQNVSTVSTETLAEHRKVLLKRTIGCLIRHTPTMFEEKIETIKETISGNFITFELDPRTENLIATVKCVYCTKIATVYQTPSPINPYIWKTPNFDRHVRVMHKNRLENSSSNDSGDENYLESNGRKKTLGDVEKAMDKEDNLKMADEVESKEVLSDSNKVIHSESKDYIEPTEILSSSDKNKALEVVGQDERKEVLRKSDKEIDSKSKDYIEQKDTLSGSDKDNILEMATLSEPRKKKKSKKSAKNEPKEVQSDSVGEKDLQSVFDEQKDSQPDLKPALVDFRILKNGHKTRHGNEFIVSTHTCAFDTILHSFASTYANNSNVRDQLDGSNSKMSELLKSLFNRTTDSTQRTSPVDSTETYAIRNIILKELYEGWCKSGNIRKNHDTTFIDCTTGIGGLFARMCKFEENMASVIEERICSKCGSVSSKQLPFLKTTEKIRNLKTVNDYLDLNSPERSCTSCKNKCNVTMSFNNVVSVEAEPVTVRKKKKVSLGKICPELYIGNTTYTLSAVMHFDATENNYVAYIPHTNDSWKCLDYLKKGQQKVDAATEGNPFILCYVAALRCVDFEKSMKGRKTVPTVTKTLTKNEHELQDMPGIAMKPALPASKAQDQADGSKKRKNNRKDRSSSKKTK